MKVRNIISLTFLMLIAFACKNDEMGNIINPDQGILVKYSIDGNWQNPLDIEAITKSGTRGLNTSNKPPVIVEDQVKDVWVFQFDGTSGDSPLIGPQRYVEDLSAPLILVNRGSKTQRLLFVANTGRPFYQWNVKPRETTYAGLIETLSDVNSESILYYDNTLIMVASADVDTDGSVTNIEVNLKRNVARVELNLSCEAPNIVVDSVALFNIPSKVNRFASLLDYWAPYPLPGYMEYINYPAVSTTMPSDGSMETFYWYMPQNLQGVVDNDNVKTKNIFAPKTATYIKIYAKDTSDDNAQVIYTFYPGENMVDNFNLKPNGAYRLHVHIVGKDDAIVDSRIDDMSQVVDMAGKPANTYILNPPKTSSSTYRIYPSNVDKYWGPLYENVEANMLKDNVEWGIDVLWMDEQFLVTNASGDGNINITKGSGKGVHDYFDIKVPSSSKQGNFVVYIYKSGDASKTPLWSWHMWVTNYNPDGGTFVPTLGQFVYKVEGGSVHRYGGAYWWQRVSGENYFMNSFMMDRNLGQRGEMVKITNTVTDTKLDYYGLLYYQFGRKDPLPADVKLWKLDGSEINYDFYTNNRQFSIVGGFGSNVDMKTAVTNPMSHIDLYGKPNADAWYDTNINIGNRDMMLWGDRNVLGFSENLKRSKYKSLFDPCPYGWRVPSSTAYSDFRSTLTLGENTGRAGLEWIINDIAGARYWPDNSKEGNNIVDGTIFFAPSSLRSNYEGKTRYKGYALMWNSFVSSENILRSTYVIGNSISYGASSVLSYGASVRCVKN